LNPHTRSTNLGSTRKGARPDIAFCPDESMRLAPPPTTINHLPIHSFAVVQCSALIQL
jgi:hypothetical protein